MMPDDISDCGAGNGDASSEICRTKSTKMRFRRAMQSRATPKAISTRPPEKEFTMNFIKNFLREEDGVTAIEYGLIAALVGVAIVASVTLLGTELENVFEKITLELK
jgi:pilus assembly protein Flp/PilA